MKKNLLTFLFVIAFICVGVSVASAKNTSSTEKPVAVSKKLSPAKIISNKIKALEAKCGTTMTPCASQLQDLINANFFYEIQCAPNFLVGCAPGEEANLLRAAAIYEGCLWWNGYNSKNIDKTKDRNKKQEPNG